MKTRLKLVMINIIPLPFLLGLAGCFLFLTAGDTLWINAWVYLCLHFLYLLVSSLYLIKKNPDALENRNKLSISRSDLPFLLLFSFSFSTIFIFSALNHRFEGLKFPLYISAFGIAFLLSAYILFIWSIRSNPFASKGLLLHKDQTIVTDGPYAVIRHPIYTASVLLGIGIALTLEAPLALIPAAGLPFVYAIRITKEEKILAAEFPEYKYYINNITYRLIPGIW